MRLKEIIFVFILFFFITAIFFHKTFLKGFVPFPGDLVVGGYNPYSSYSFFGYTPGGFPNKAQDFDVLKLLYPGKYFSIDSFKNFQIPLWNPYNFSGNPHLASVQSGSFYPLNVIFIIFPFNFAWSFYIYIQPLLAAFFTFLLLRELRLNFKSALFGALIFSFSSYFIVWMEYGNIGHSIIWLPLLMWLSLKNINKPTFEKSFLMIIFFTFSILAGYIQTSFYVFVFVFSFYLFNIFLNKDKKLIHMLLLFPIFIAPLFISAFQIFPMLELFNNSSRTSYGPSAYLDLLIQPFHLATLFAPDFFGNPATRNYWINGTYIERVSYVGVLPLILALYAFLKRRTPVLWFFTGSLVTTYLISFDTIFSRIFYSFNIPFISTTVPTRAMFIFCFSLSVLASYGLENFEKSKEKIKSLYISVVLIGLVFIFLWFFVFTAQNIFKNETWILNLSISKRNLILPTMFFLISILLLFLFYKFKKIKKYIIIVLFFLLIFDLYYFFQKITPFSPVESIYPKTEIFTFLKRIQGINRFWGYGSGYIEANIQTYEKIYSTDGYDALHIKRYGEFVSASKTGKIPKKIPRSEGDLAYGYGADDLRTNPYRQRALNLLGVKYVLHKKEIDNNIPDYQTFNEKIYKMIWNKGSWQIYENKEVLPRIFLSGNYIVESKNKEIIKNIYNSNFNLREKIILEERLPEDFHPAKDENAKIDVIKYTPNKIIIGSTSKTNTLLFMSDNYYPGWRAQIDGKEQKIYRADYTFRAIPVENGKHEIVLWYYPESFNLGLKITLITFLGLFGIVLLNRIKPIKYV